MRSLQLIDRFQIHRGIFPDRGMRAAAGFDTQHAIGRKRTLANKELGVLARVDVVGDHGQVEGRPEGAAQLLDQRRLARPDRPAHAQREDAPPRAGVGAWPVVMVLVRAVPGEEAAAIINKIYSAPPELARKVKDVLE